MVTNPNILLYMLKDDSNDKYSEEWFEEILSMYNVTDLSDFKDRVFKKNSDEYEIYKVNAKYKYKVTSTGYKKVNNTNYAITKDGFVPIFVSERIPYETNYINTIKGELIKVESGYYFNTKNDQNFISLDEITEQKIYFEAIVIRTYNDKYDFYTEFTERCYMFEALFSYLNSKIELDNLYGNYDLILRPGVYVPNRDLELGLYDVRLIGSYGSIDYSDDEYSFDIYESWNNLEIISSSKLIVNSGEYGLIKK